MLWTNVSARRPFVSATILCLCLATWSRSARAGDCDYPVVGEAPKRARHLPKYCRAPFEGQLMEPDLALDLAQGAERARYVLDLTLTATRAYWNERVRHLGELHEIDKRGLEDKLEAAEQEVEAVRPSWYERPPVVAAGTLVAVGVVSTLTLLLVNAFKKDSP